MRRKAEILFVMQTCSNSALLTLFIDIELFCALLFVFEKYIMRLIWSNKRFYDTLVKEIISIVHKLINKLDRLLQLSSNSMYMLHDTL